MTPIFPSLMESFLYDCISLWFLFSNFFLIVFPAQLSTYNLGPSISLVCCSEPLDFRVKVALASWRCFDFAINGQETEGKPARDCAMDPGSFNERPASLELILCFDEGEDKK